MSNNAMTNLLVGLYSLYAVWVVWVIGVLVYYGWLLAQGTMPAVPAIAAALFVAAYGSTAIYSSLQRDLS